MKKNIRRFAYSGTFGIVLFFLALLLFGLCSFQDYGLAGDAYEERRTCLVNYKYLVPSVSQIQTETVNFPEVAELSEYADRYYGVALQMPTLVVEHFFDFTLTYNQIFQMRHLYTFLLYFVGCIFFFLLARQLTGNDILACMGTAMFVLSPHILANSLYNIKDIPFLSIFIVNLYFSIRFLRKPVLGNIALLGIASALCTNTRIIGGIVIFTCLLLYLMDKTRYKTFSKALATCLLCGLVCFTFYILITPVTWQSPFHAIIETLRTFSSFNVYHFNNYFMGTMLDGAELPWYYLPVWIGMTTPVFYLILFFIGLFYTAASVVHHRKTLSLYTEKLFLFLTIAVPLIYVFIKTPILYNGWRHFYFIYSVLILFALLGFQSLLRHWPRCQKILCGFMALYFLSLIVWIGRNHPAEYVYFNYPSRAYANANMDKDYWNVGAASSVEYLLTNSAQEPLSVVFYPHSWYSAKIFSPAEQARILSAPRQYPQSADYYLYTFLQDPATERFYGYYYYEPFFIREASGIQYNALFKRTYDLTCISNLKLNTAQASLLYGADEIDWDVSPQGENSWLFTGTLKQAINTDRLYLSCLDSSVSLEDIQIEDTAGQKQIASAEELLSDINSGFWIFFNPCTPTKINFRLTFLENRESYLLLFHAVEPRTSDTASASRHSLLSLSTGINWTEAENAADSSLNTKWHAPSQDSGTEVLLTLSEERQLQGFSLETGGKDWDAPQNLQIAASLDGESWSPLAYTTTNQIDFLFPPVSCRYLRLTIGKHSEEVPSEWTIAEIFLYTAQKNIALIQK